MCLSSISRWITALVLVVPIWLDGCATHTYGSSALAGEHLLSQVKVGSSTTADLKRLLGDPAEIESKEAGREIWVYHYVEYQGAYVPLFGAVSTGDRQESVVEFHIQDGQVERLERLRTRHNNGL